MATTTKQYKYWIDGSCHNYQGVGPADFDVYVKEAMRLAGLAVKRLQSPTDKDFARVWNVLFKAPKTDQVKYPRSDQWYKYHGYTKDPATGTYAKDPAHSRTILDHVVSDLSHFATSWTQTTVRMDADVVIYSNDFKGFTQDPKTPQLWYDPDNKMRINIPYVDANGRPVLPYTYAIMTCGTPAARMDIFELAWRCLTNPGKKYTQILDGAKPVPDNVTVSMDLHSELNLTRIILHEFMHFCVYARGDFRPEGKSPAGRWGAAMGLTKRDAWLNADSLALLGYLAGMADVKKVGKTKGGFSLDRNWDLIPGRNDLEHVLSSADIVNPPWDLKWDTNWQGVRTTSGYVGNKAIEGSLIFYDDLTN